MFCRSRDVIFPLYAAELSKQINREEKSRRERESIRVRRRLQLPLLNPNMFDGRYFYTDLNPLLPAHREVDNYSNLVSSEVNLFP